MPEPGSVSGLQCQGQRPWTQTGAQEVPSEHQEPFCAGCGPGHPALGVPAGEGAGADGSRRPCQPQQFCDPDEWKKAEKVANTKTSPE